MAKVGTCTHPDGRGKQCSEEDCRYWCASGRSCDECMLAAMCNAFERVDDSSQTTIEFDFG